MINFFTNLRSDEGPTNSNDALLSTICCDIHEGPLWALTAKSTPKQSESSHIAAAFAPKNASWHLDTAMTADYIIDALGLEPHPEGGFYRQTWVADAATGERPVGTAIYFLLKAGAPSHWHKVDATEIWHFHAGAPLLLRIAETDQGPAKIQMLGTDLQAGHLPQGIVPTDHWQSAETQGDWTLVSCTVSPAFLFDGFTLAPPGFDVLD